MRLKKNMFLENKGFSMVELLIAVAIAAIVGASVFGFMTVGAKTFSFNSADVSIQNESQLAFNQIQELVIDTAVGVEYFKMPSEDPLSYDELTDDGYDKKLVLYNLDQYDTERNRIYEIYWNHTTHELRYSEYESELKDGKVEKKDPSTALVDNVLMSEDIYGFSVDLSRLISNRVVRIGFTYEKGGRRQSSSHNITLRNQVVSSNELEEHLKNAYTLSENVIPHHIEGKKIIYAEPGETIQLASLGYKVFDSATPPNDITAEQPLVYAFASGSVHRKEANPTTIDYNTGVLKVSSYETAGHFDVLVYCSNDNSVKLPVTVRVVYNKEISISCNKISASDSEHPTGTGGEVFLKAGDIFELEATPEITWTVAKAMSALAPDEILDPDDETKLNNIENGIKNGLEFEGGKGYGQEANGGLFYIDGSPTATTNGMKAKFKMSSTFSFTTGLSGNYYIEKISERVKCGYSRNKFGGNVFKDWSLGRAYRKKGDYKIEKPSGNVWRGIDINSPISTFSTTDKIKYPMDTNHAEFLEVYVTEVPGDIEIPRSIWMLDDGGHANWHWIIPNTMDPTKSIKFRIISHYGDVRGTGVPGNATYVLPKSPFTSSSTFVATSDPLEYYYDKLRLNYANSEYTNIKVTAVPGDTSERECDSEYITYYVRPFNTKTSEAVGCKDKVIIPVDYNDSFYNERQNVVKTGKALTNSKGWYLREYKNGSWQDYSNPSDKTLVKRSGDQNNNWDSLFAYYTHYIDNQRTFNLMFKTDISKWDNRIPSRIRLVPKWVGKKLDYSTLSESDYDYAIEDNYVECVFWNIKVPYRPSKWQKIFEDIINKLLKIEDADTKVYEIDGNNYETCYFPAPGEPGFPNMNVENAIWSNVGFDKASGYFSGNNDEYELRYNLKKLDISGTVKWRLTLKWEDSNSNLVDIADYEYDANSKEWIIRDH